MNTYTLKSVAQKHLSKFKNYRELGTYSEVDFANSFNQCINEMYSTCNALILHEVMTAATGRKIYIIGADIDPSTGLVAFKFTHI